MKFRSSVRRLCEALGYVVREREEYEAEQTTFQNVADRIGAAQQELARHRPIIDLSDPSDSPLGTDLIYTPTFCYDGLMTDPNVIHNHDFMRDPRFVRAYALGHQALGHDHNMFWRLHVALWCATHAAKLPGDFVECGVWRGFLSTAIINYVDWSRLNKTFYLFDTFAGLDEQHLTASELANRQKLDHFQQFYVDYYEFVKDHFAQYDRIELVRGTVPETLSTIDIGWVSFISIDLNCTLPEIAAANYFWDKLVPGAIMLLDDYGFVSYEEQKCGFDDFAVQRSVEILALPTGQGLIVKP